MPRSHHPANCRPSKLPGIAVRPLPDLEWSEMEGNRMSGAAVPVASVGEQPLTVDEFNAADDAAARALLAGCLDIERWVADVTAGRPYSDRNALLHNASESAGQITWAEVAGALLRHPRIGEKATGGGSADAALSATEQSGVAESDAAALAAGNLAYEQRFGYIYLICASGLSGAQMLAALRERLTHDDEQERQVVMDELRKIAALRLAKAISA
jgi:2-oxo-4-hydroxy-4-carboxy-5-ureidoimidazoline decarboxylase